MTIIMIRFFTLLFAASCLTAFGQVDFPYNPDGNIDGLIGVQDLQDFLSIYGQEFQVVDSVEYWDSQINASSCFIYYHFSGHHSYDPGLHYHYDIPSSCEVVHITTYYYAADPQNTARDLRLPTENLVTGQTIQFVFHPNGPALYETGNNGWNHPGKIEIMALQEGAWVEVGAIYDYSGCTSGSCHTNYYSDPDTNEKVLWNGQSWVQLDTPVQVLNPDPNE